MPVCDVAPTFPSPPRAASPPPDPVLAAALRRGDAGALDAVYHAHAPALLRLAGQLTGSRADAEDVVHDVFVALPDLVRRYDERGAFAGWLRTLVARRALDRVRAGRRRREVPLVPDAGPGASAAAGGPGVLAQLEAGERAARLRAAVAVLPDGLRAAFVLRAVEGWTHAAVAAALGIRVGTAEVRYFRAVRRLRDLLGDLL